MNSCSTFCVAAQHQFSARVAARDLSHYLRKGPIATTLRLLDRLLGRLGSTTDYVLMDPAMCLQCGAAITEKTLVDVKD